MDTLSNILEHKGHMTQQKHFVPVTPLCTANLFKKRGSDDRIVTS